MFALVSTTFNLTSLMRILNIIESILLVLAYTVLALPFIGISVAVAYGLAKHTLHLL